MTQHRLADDPGGGHRLPGTRRIISRENISTVKLVRRGHAMPRGLARNLFLVRSAQEVMLRDFAVLDAATTFSEFLRMSEDLGGLRHVVVTRERQIIRTPYVST